VPRRKDALVPPKQSTSIGAEPSSLADCSSMGACIISSMPSIVTLGR
jgi:hypothetical protein